MQDKNTTLNANNSNSYLFDENPEMIDRAQIETIPIPHRQADNKHQ